jgi:predicted metal-dependent hydrolase
MRDGAYFEAHEALEDAWRAADPAEKDFFQGLVHVTVAWYQAGRGNRVGFERQLTKAERRLTEFQPQHRGVDLDSVLAQVRSAAARGSLQPPPIEI